MNSLKSFLLAAQTQEKTGTVLGATEGFLSKITSNWLTNCLCCIIFLTVLLAIIIIILITERKRKEEERGRIQFHDERFRR